MDILLSVSSGQIISEDLMVLRTEIADASGERQALLITLKRIVGTVYFSTAICRCYNSLIHVFLIPG